MLFSEFALSAPILRAVTEQRYTIATPIQAQAIPPVLQGRDVLGCAQTGTGKTAAFALPILQHLSTKPRPSGHTRPLSRALILCPTRELATQIAQGFKDYGAHLNLTHVVLFGGVSQHHQVQSLKRGVDIIVATPGRLLDLMEQRHVDLRAIEVLVLDEADRMLDMGFIHPIRQIVAKLSHQRQTLLFSATMPPEIRQLASSLMRNPVSIQVAPKSTTADNIDQSVYFVDKSNKAALLAHLVNNLPMSRAIVFTRTKHGADKVVRNLHARGIRSEAIHGNKSQNARERALQNFRSNKLHVLVATDIASRGIDIDDISHVVNYDISHEPETYVHRIGRTARAGASGAAVSFCGPDERSNLKAIEKLIRRPIPVKNDQPKYEPNAPRDSEPRHFAPVQRADDRRPGNAHSHQRPRHHAAPAPSRSGHGRPQQERSQPAATRTSRHTHPLHAPAAQGHNQHRRKPARRRRF